MPLMAYRDSGGHFAVRYVPAFGGWRGKPGRIGRIGRTGRRGGGLGGRPPPEQHSSAQLHVSRARHDRGMREPTAGGDGIYARFFFSSHLVERAAIMSIEFDPQLSRSLTLNTRIERMRMCILIQFSSDDA